MGLFDFGGRDTSSDGKSIGDVVKEVVTTAFIGYAGFVGAYSGVADAGSPGTQAEQAGHSIAMNAETTQTAALNEATVSIGDSGTGQCK
jgi:hypothetical protein